MSASVSFVGRLTKDGEVKTIGTGPALTFSVAVDTGFGDKKTTTFFNCTYFRKAEGLVPLMVKGTQVFVTGELTLRIWTNKEGKEVTSPSINVASVELVGSKPTGATSGNDSRAAAPAAAKKPVTKTPAEVLEDEEAPF